MGKEYWSFFILCAILSQGICALSEKENGQFSSLKSRQKRLIDTSSNGNKPVKLEKVPYIVNVQRDGSNQCGGTILTSTFVITAAHCFMQKNSTYSVLAGSESLKKGVRHKVEKIIINSNFHPPAFPNDLALLVISPPLDLVHSRNRNITLHNGKLAKNAKGVISGWGCTDLTENNVVFPTDLRSITVPIISQKECQKAFPKYTISKKEVCTLDESGEKGSCNGDSGGPLAVDGKLLGVLSWGGKAGNGDPDVFVNLSYPEYAKWISSNIKH